VGAVVRVGGSCEDGDWEVYVMGNVRLVGDLALRALRTRKQ
jgi:hypothetical protein